MIRTMFVALWILSLSVVAGAQEFTGDISGRIEDTSHALVPGVEVTLKGPAVQGVRTATSDDKGFYRFSLIPPGAYALTFELVGFKTLVQNGVEVGVGNTASVNMQMQLAVVAETVNVNGETPVIDLENATVGVNFDEAMLRDIPNQRDIFAVLAETPGITMLNFDVGGSTMGVQSGYRTYGLAGQNLISIDGVNATEGSAGQGLYMDYGAIADVKVAAAANSAEIPVAGAAVSTVIKSGGNSPHGEFYIDGSNPTFQSKGPSRLGFSARDINGQIGGPFIRDKFWYFFSYRDDYSGSPTTILNQPKGTPSTYSTQLQNFTIKLNYQLSSSNTLTFMTQANQKYQPFRGGVVVNSSSQYTYESTANSDSWSEASKIELTHVIDKRKTLDMSINNFGYQWPSKARNANLPILDNISGIRTGGYQTPSLIQQRRWHYNANFSIYAGKHDIKGGYMFQWYAPRITQYGSSAGHLLVETNSGVPTYFTTDNGPVWTENIVSQNSLFVQDKYQVTSRLVLNLGLRYDRYHSYYPEERFGLNGNKPCQAGGACTMGPYVTPTVTPANSVAVFNTFVPRVAFVYSLFKKTNTALRGSWGRYPYNPSELPGTVNPINLISTRYAWDPAVLGSDPVAGARLITPAYAASLPIQSGGAQLTAAAVDPNLKDAYTEEYTVGLEHQLLSELGLHVNLVRMIQKNAYGVLDRLHTASAFAPVAAIDPGPDGLLGDSDDKRITVFERLNGATPIDNYLTNQPIGDNYTTVEFGAMKRMRNHWMLMPAFDWTKRNLAQLFNGDPNVFLYGLTSNVHTTGWTAKVIAQYTLPHGWLISANYQGQKGEAYGRTVTVQAANLTAANPARTTALSQGSISIYTQPAGSYYLPNVSLLGMRLQKEVAFYRDQQKLQFMVSLYNLTNASTVTSVNILSGRAVSGSTTIPTFGQPFGVMNGSTARFGLRYVF